MQKFFDFPTIILNSNLKLVEFKVENEKKKILPSVKESEYGPGKAETIGLVEFL